MPKFRETMIQFQEWRDGRRDGRRDRTPGETAAQKDKQALFNMIFLVTTRCSASTTAVEWHLKVKDMGHDVSMTKIIGSQSAYKKSAQFTNSFLR